MTNLISYEADHRIILMKMELIDKETSDKAIHDTLQLMVQYQCFTLLSDYRDTVMPLTTIDIYFLQKKWLAEFKKFDILPAKPKRAILIKNNQTNFADFRFLETTAINNNQRVKMFFDYELALAWLKN